MSTKRRGKKETKQESPTQYKVVDPISLADLENIHTRKGKYPTRPSPFGQLTWEEAKREKEEKLKTLRKERSPSLIDIFGIRMAISDIPKSECKMDKKAEAGGTMPTKGTGAW